mgnify:CR=1 FL=1
MMNIWHDIAPERIKSDDFVACIEISKGSEAILPKTLVKCYPIGVIKMIDSQSIDEKIIAIPDRDPNYNAYRDVNSLPRHILDEIMHFFSVYKMLEGKETIVKELCGRDVAIDLVSKCIKAYEDKFGD